MPVHTLKTLIKLEGHIGAEAAEGVSEWLRAHPKGQVDLHGCESVHTAVLQTLLALRPRIKRVPADALLARVVSPRKETP